MAGNLPAMVSNSAPSYGAVEGVTEVCMRMVASVGLRHARGGWMVTSDADWNRDPLTSESSMVISVFQKPDLATESQMS
jgi:hypothetical protein